MKRTMFPCASFTSCVVLVLMVVVVSDTASFYMKTNTEPYGHEGCLACAYT